MSTTTHVLRLRPPLRAFAVAAAFAVVGVVFVIAPETFGWNLITRFIGIGFLVICLLVVALAVWAMRRERTEIELDDEGYRITGRSGPRSGSWSEVATVTRGDGMVVLYGRDGSRTVMGRPRGGRGDLDALGADIARRLDADRGYGSVPFGQADPQA